MLLTIESPEADSLARDLAALTGGSVADAVVVALRERLERTRNKPKVEPLTGDAFVKRALALAAAFRENYDTRPITKQERDEAWGEPL